MKIVINEVSPRMAKHIQDTATQIVNNAGIDPALMGFFINRIAHLARSAYFTGIIDYLDDQRKKGVTFMSEYTPIPNRSMFATVIQRRINQMRLPLKASTKEVQEKMRTAPIGSLEDLAYIAIANPLEPETLIKALKVIGVE